MRVSKQQGPCWCGPCRLLGLPLIACFIPWFGAQHSDLPHLQSTLALCWSTSLILVFKSVLVICSGSSVFNVLEYCLVKPMGMLGSVLHKFAHRFKLQERKQTSIITLNNPIHLHLIYVTSTILFTLITQVEHLYCEEWMKNLLTGH